MKTLPHFLLFTALFFCIPFSYAQHAHKIDSLGKKLNEALHDTVRVKVLLNLSGETLNQGDPKKALEWAQKSLHLAERNNFQRALGGIYNAMATAYVTMSDYPKGMECHQKALAIRLARNDKKGIAGSYNNIGIIYFNLSDFPKTLEYFQKSLKMQEELKNNYLIAATIGNIAVVYEQLHDDSLSMVFQQKSFDMHKVMNNRSDMVSSLNNLGTLYRKKKQLNKALDMHNQALKIALELDEKDKMKLTYGNVGTLYLAMNKPKEALEMFLKAKEFTEENDDKKDRSTLYSLMAQAFLKLGKPNDAVTYFNQALELAKSAGNLNEQKEAAQGLYEINKSKGDYKTAVTFLEIARQLNDSIFNSSKNESLNSLKTQFALDRQEVQLQSKAEEELKKQEEEKARQRIIIYVALCVLILVLVFSYFLLQRFRITRKQNRIIESQKILVEEKNKEITDSIMYAKRLQQAITPTVELVKQTFPGSFIYFQPKDIIAGDFYWMERKGNDVYIAAADCTGHGVPGAMVSVVCCNALNRALKEFDLSHTGPLLDKTRDLVLETFAKSGEEIKDGMDISLLRFIDYDQTASLLSLEWSGANNSFWYIEGNEFKTIKCDKQSIGKTDNPMPFHSHMLSLPKTSSVYLYTDGFADQFGGPKGKKFKYKQLEELLLRINYLPGPEQVTIIEHSFETWKGGLEQVDDVCIIGITLS
ncbi:MAG: tetratricopeptide repeat protein [Bacteroidetes bacterium]|nr:tetratricopeptide repeat protein [Bacteroidota bacterium]